jgi:hypothetical protein
VSEVSGDQHRLRKVENQIAQVSDQPFLNSFSQVLKFHEPGDLHTYYKTSKRRFDKLNLAHNGDNGDKGDSQPDIHEPILLYEAFSNLLPIHDQNPLAEETCVQQDH